MKRKWFGKSKSIRRLFVVFYTLLFFLFLMDVFIHKHAGFSVEKLPFFFPLYAFFSCVLIFAVSKGVMKILKRGADYYER